MNEEGVENQLPPGREPGVVEDTGLNINTNINKNSKETRDTAEEPPAPLDVPKETPGLSPNPEEDNPAGLEIKDEVKSTAGEAGMDWFEPLEDDDDPDNESLAGETESVAGSERTMKKIYM